MTEKADRQRTLAARVVLVLSLAALVADGWIAQVWGRRWDATRELWLARSTGWTAVGALVFALSATPAGRLLARLPGRSRDVSWVPAFRRAFGIAAGSFALLHAATVFGGYLRGAWVAVLSFSYLRAGLLALIIQCAMLATSFPSLVRHLRVKAWKPLHRLGYLVAILVLQHLLLSPFAPRAMTLELFAAVFAVGLLRLLPRSPTSDAQ